MFVSWFWITYYWNIKTQIVVLRMKLCLKFFLGVSECSWNGVPSEWNFTEFNAGGARRKRSKSSFVEVQSVTCRRLSPGRFCRKFLPKLIVWSVIVLTVSVCGGLYFFFSIDWIVWPTYLSHIHKECYKLGVLRPWPSFPEWSNLLNFM